MNTIIAEIEAIRVRNNGLWMAILQLALQAVPTQAKAIVRDINANDRKISELLGKLADE